MSEAQETFKKGLFDWLNSLAKTLATLSVVITFGMTVASPWVKPYINVPVKLEATMDQLEVIMQTMAENQKGLQYIEYKGGGIILSQTEKSLEIMYLLRRAVSCESVLKARFWSHDKGYFVYSEVTPSVRSPVTEEFNPFIVRVPIPSSLQPGRYNYIPTLSPIDCGVYQMSVAVPPTTTFEIK